MPCSVRPDARCGPRLQCLAMSSPRLSVLLPTRNAGCYLQQAVDSILSQTYSDFELLVIDDGTTDDSLKQLDARDPRLRVVSSDGEGIVAALNTGARHASGEMFARMDADDIALPQRFERQLGYLDAYPEVGIVGAQVDIFHDGQPVGEGYKRYQSWINGLVNPEQIARAIFIESPIPHPTAIIRRSVFERLGGYRDSEWAEDYDLWLRAHVAGFAMGKPQEVLLRWRDGARRLSRTDTRYAIKRFIQAKAFYLASTHLEIRNAVIWGAGETGKLLHDALRKQGVFVTGFIDIDPRKIGGKKRGLLVFPHEKVSELNALIVVAVGARGARTQIEEALHKQNLIEGEDYIFAA